MQTYTKNIIVGLTLGLTAGIVVLAQQHTDSQVPHHAHTPQSYSHQKNSIPHQEIPLITALDANRNGEIDAEEIANASLTLLTLDANKDGKLTRDEFLPPVPEGYAKVKHQAQPIPHRQTK